MVGQETRIRHGKSTSVEPRRRSGPSSTIHYPPSIINRSAFTLIELLVVISIIALLLAILLPTLSRVRKQAQAVACQSGMHGWAILFAAYQNDNDGRLPWGRDETGQIPWPRQMEIHSGLDLRKAMLCPTASKLQAAGAPRTRGSFLACGTTFQAWRYELSSGEGGAEGTYLSWNGSYAMNNHLRLSGRIERVKPSVLPVFLDSRDCLASFSSAEAGEPPPCEDAPLGLTGNLYDEAAEVAIDRHRGGINGLFADGAIRIVGIKELWTLAWHKEYNTAGRWTQAGGAKAEDWPLWMRGFKDY